LRGSSGAPESQDPKPPVGPYFKEDVRASEFPKFDGSAKTFDLWLAKGNYFYTYSYGTKLANALGQVATFNFKGLAATWWAGLPQDEQDAKTQEWPVLWDYI
jgi:hypothetical protein